MEATVVLPNQLFSNHPHIKENPVFLVEEDAFFTRFNFHKKKLILHRASMKAYEDFIDGDVRYIENQKGKTLDKLFENLRANNIKKIQMTEILDHKLEEKIKQYSRQHSIELSISNNPGFLVETNWINEYFGARKFRMISFYIEQRKKLKILLKGNKPVGEKWSFDPQNRKKLPKDIKIPQPWLPETGIRVKEATNYVLRKFPDNPCDFENFCYPIMRKDALKQLDDFVENRLEFFGNYQDAITKRSDYLFHSILSSSLNIGILSPQDAIERVIREFYERDLSINSVEGFIRQIIGWREYMRAVYLIKGKYMFESNLWGFDKPLPNSFYDASTGLEPLDNVLTKVNNTAYAHHIERLMIIGNFTLLAGIAPKDVYRWFMEMFIDSYEWVMIPNVLAMSQFADDSITTKPYISSSAYIIKMSDYGKGKWSKIWDALFWNFIHENRDKIEKIPRMQVMLYNLDKMCEEKMNDYRERARQFLEEKGNT